MPGAQLPAGLHGRLNGTACNRSYGGAADMALLRSLPQLHVFIVPTACKAQMQMQMPPNAAVRRERCTHCHRCGSAQRDGLCIHCELHAALWKGY